MHPALQLPARHLNASVMVGTPSPTEGSVVRLTEGVGLRSVLEA
jgi:hypothetical protein